MTVYQLFAEFDAIMCACVVAFAVIGFALLVKSSMENRENSDE